jgi:hypothetical protein
LRAYGASFGEGDATFPLALIEEAVGAAGVREQRRRLLPAVAVVVFVLGLCLFSGEGYREVACKLGGWLGPLAGRGGWRVPGTAALARARRRVGPAPLRVLFARLAGPLADAGTPGAWACGRLLVALDGTVLDVPYTPANIAAFGPPPVRRGAGPCPQVRLVTMAACGTRGLIDAVFGGRRASEQDLACKIATRGRLRRGMLVIADRNFCGYPSAACLAATGADVLIRVKSSQWLPVLERLPDGSARSVLAEPASGRRHAFARHNGHLLPGPPAGLPVRLIEADITLTPAGGTARTGHYRLITTLLDPVQAPAGAVAACYAQRWEIETSYREIRNQLPGNQGIHPRRRADTALQRPRRHRPGNLGPALHLPAHPHRPRPRRRHQRRPRPRPDLLHHHPARHPPRHHQRHRHQHRHRSAGLPAAPRRQRSYPRLTPASTTQRRTARANLTGTITYNITITAPAQATGLPRP